MDRTSTLFLMVLFGVAFIGGLAMSLVNLVLFVRNDGVAGQPMRALLSIGAPVVTVVAGAATWRLRRKLNAKVP